ncbi:conserved hypothetical protein [Pantoea brenneri]|uniref:Uncharacterized protein n=1 Tax=Pantoea brenneri TaxID=472694 RepID=A0AAX3J9C8_9GAMM|nr:conserved hypothetical protein [Pantoea brenneri]
MEDGFFTVDDKCVARIVAALITHNVIRAFSQKVYNLTFTFVTPLGAQYDDVLTHFSKSPIA